MLLGEHLPCKHDTHALLRPSELLLALDVVAVLLEVEAVLQAVVGNRLLNQHTC